MPQGVEISQLTRAVAEKHTDRIAELLNRIPLLTYTASGVLAEVSNRGKQLTGKWQQSLVAMQGGEVVGVLIAHEKKAALPWYPVDSCYLSEIAVDQSLEGHGLARLMTERWLNDTAGLSPHSLQTNSADSNLPVRRFYERLGFQEVSRKCYDDPSRVDVMMFRPGTGIEADDARAIADLRAQAGRSPATLSGIIL